MLLKFKLAHKTFATFFAFEPFFVNVHVHVDFRVAL